MGVSMSSHLINYASCATPIPCSRRSGGVVQAVPAREGDGESEGASGGIGDWLVDYKDGMEYEVYSLPLVVPARSRLYGMSFGR